MDPMLDPGNDWDFYPCMLDDAPAFILLNLWYGRYAPIDLADHVYWCQIELRDADVHGMGTKEEEEVLLNAEDVIISEAIKSLLFVGRIRNAGTWELVFYGPAGCEAPLRSASEAALAATGHVFEIESREDAAWMYYKEYLFPERERFEWMQNRRTVETLAKNGDALTKPRLVEHWINFADVDEKRTFEERVRALHFEIEEIQTPDDQPLRIKVQRIDSVQLEDIHRVVMTLIELSKKHGGDYDGWETSVETGSPCSEL